MRIIYPQKLNKGDTIGIITPSASAAKIKKAELALAQKKLESYGFKIVFGKNLFKGTRLDIERVGQRINDVHLMFSNRKIKAIMAVIGGYTSNQLLPYLDYKLIKRNPKIFLGYSDITALQNAIFAKTGLITFSGPCFINFAQKFAPFDFEEKSFQQILFEREKIIQIRSSLVFAEDEWWKNPQKPRKLKKNSGWRIIKNGRAQGIIVGGNLSTLLLLLNTPYCPDFRNKILFIEEDPVINKKTIERMFAQLNQSVIPKIKGLVVGRFAPKSGLTEKDEKKLLERLTLDHDVPTIANVDFGHTGPIITFPIGGKCKIDTYKNSIEFVGPFVV